MVRVHIKESKDRLFPQGGVCLLGEDGERVMPSGSNFSLPRGTRHGSRPIFHFASGAPLSRELFVWRVREALEPWGIDEKKYLGHSFRIGAATEAAAAGVQNCLIKTLGRWESSDYHTYVRVPRDQLASISKRLSTA